MPDEPTARPAAFFRKVDTPTAEVDAAEALHQPLVDAVRSLVDATIRTTVGPDAIARATASVEAALTELRAAQVPGPYGVEYNGEGRSWNWGNAVVGQRNAIAPPLRMERDDSGLVHSDVVLGAAYEGPPGSVHGGVTALLLDHIMGETASAGHTRITFTGTLTIKYVKPTPLGAIRLESKITGEDGRKVYVGATVADAEGVTVEADGVFIVPKWAQP